MSDPSLPAMGIIFNKVCMLVTACALTLVPGFKEPERSLLSRRDQGTALVVFLVLGLVEEVIACPARLAQPTDRSRLRCWSGSRFDTAATAAARTVRTLL
jgi:hypothetical protein